jgi:hypothetical protein
MFCWYYRIRISHALDGDRALPKGVEKHINQCGSCRRFYQGSLAVADQLRREAAEMLGHRVDVDLGGETLSSSATKLVFPSLHLWRAAAAVLVVLAAGVIFWSVTKPEPVVNQKKELQTFADIVYEHGFAADTFALKTGDSLQMLVANPFQAEMSRITEDANRALDFLMVNLVSNQTEIPNKKPGT